MLCISYVATAMFVFRAARAVKTDVQGVGQNALEGHEWLKSISAEGPTMTCSVNDTAHCIFGSGMGACTLEVDLGVHVDVGPTDSGYEVDVISQDVAMEYPSPYKLLQSEPITVIGHKDGSHWNMCWDSHWKHDEHVHHRAFSQPNVEDFCYYVNGLCFLWVSPCSGGCSTVNITDNLWFCPTLRYATESEWNQAALNSLTVQEKGAFIIKCASRVMDPCHVHCDFHNSFVRVPDNSYNELVMVCPPATPSPTQAPAPALGAAAAAPISATGDPHLQNVYGERFDLMKPGKHVLIQIPKGEFAEGALLRVQADARRLGGQCADLYFQELNVTGVWAEAKYTGGLHFQVRDQVYETPSWIKFGKVQIKVAHGHTNKGIRYLNLYVKHLGHAGFAVGGLLGEDDHTEAAKSPPACAHRTSLLQVATPSEQGVPVFSLAEASFA